jgi:hypothetical protein
MKWDVSRVEPLDDYKLHVELVDGRQGTFDMTPYLEKGVFRELKDPAYFRQVHVFLGAVSWPNGQDIAPETIYTAITGEPLPGWIVAEEPGE